MAVKRLITDYVLGKLSSNFVNAAYLLVHLTALYIVPNSSGSQHLSHLQSMYFSAKWNLLLMACRIGFTLQIVRISPESKIIYYIASTIFYYIFYRFCTV